MKKFLAMLVVISLLLCGCSELIPPRTTLPTETVTEATEATETEPETEPETEAETEPPVIYRNPLNGTILDAPYDGRIFAFSINNLRDALPHVNVVNADLVFETFVNGSIIRCLALYSDVSQVGAIGSIRSDRLMWNDLAMRYDAVMVHAGGSGQVIGDANTRGMDHFSVDVWNIPEEVAFRDQERVRAGYGYEHTLFAVGSGIPGYAEEKGIRTSVNPELDYHFQFADDAAPADGLTAEEIVITITVGRYKKETSMIYDAELGKYVFWQYGQAMADGITEEPEAFKNVIIMEASIGYNGIYQQVDFTKGGEGWFATGGKAVRITWSNAGENDTLEFFTEDGEPLTLSVGNTYIAITDPGSAISGIGEEAAEE